jgi:hypothetical protein
VLRRTSAVVLASAIAACAAFSSPTDPDATPVPPDASNDAAPNDAPVEASDETFPGCALFVADTFPANTHAPGWARARDAEWGQGEAVLTPDTQYKRGAIFLTGLGDATALHVRFDVRLEHPADDGGTEHGDGLTFFWLNDATFSIGDDGFGECTTGATNPNGYAFTLSTLGLTMSLRDAQKCDWDSASTNLPFRFGGSHPVAIDITQTKIDARIEDVVFTSAVTRGFTTNTVGFSAVTGGYSCRHAVTNVKIWVCH